MADEVRLIDANKLKQVLEVLCKDERNPLNITAIAYFALCELVDTMPTIEAEPVVRCKNCKYRQDDDFCGGRGWPAQLVPDDGYCDRGARMDGDKDNNVRNLTDEETAIYESWIESETKDTALNIMDGDGDA